MKIWWICYLCILLLQMLFDLAKQGMMRKFSGSWKIDSMYASEQKSQAADSESEVVGAWVNFHQLLEPAILPPWPLSRYVRGVSERIIREMCSDLQHECLRLSQHDSAGSQQWFCLSKGLFTFFLLCATETMLNKVYWQQNKIHTYWYCLRIFTKTIVDCDILLLLFVFCHNCT
jgi:hypothetical protein